MNKKQGINVSVKQRILALCSMLFLSTLSYAENTESRENRENRESKQNEIEKEKHEAKVDLEIRGIKEKDKDALENVEIYLGQIATEYEDGSERHQYLIQNNVDKALRAKGYYNTKYQFTLTPRAGKKPLLLLNIELDKEKVKIDEIDVQLKGEAKTDADFATLLSHVPKKDTPLLHSTYDSFKSDLEGLAFKKGYFDGHWLYHRLEVYPKDRTVDWRLGYDSGIRYRYGQITFQDNQIREDYLRNILHIHSGELYYANEVAKLTANYTSSNWFSSVIVEPKLNEQEKVVDLNVLFQPKKKNDVEVGIGFATDIGPRFQLNWKKPWINNRGHSFESRTYLSKPEQSAEFGYNIPVKSNPLHYYYQVSGSLARENQKDTQSTGGTLGFQRFWTKEQGWSFSLGVKARYDSFTQGGVSNKTLLVYPTASLNRTRTDGNRFPLWGDTQKLTLNWGTRAVGSDVDFYSWKASTAWVRTYFDNHRFVLRGEVARIYAKHFDRIPPALRYFAGGDMSVRGFGYKAISPKNAQGKLEGGSHLATGSAEYQYQVYPTWWLATFYDTGLSSSRFTASEQHSGAGIGVRWASPIGAIKFDLAKPIKSPDNKKGIQFYIGLGSEL